MIVAAHNHYTADLTVSSYLTALMWCFLENLNHRQIHYEEEDTLDAAM